MSTDAFDNGYLCTTTPYVIAGFDKMNGIRAPTKQRFRCSDSVEYILIFLKSIQLSGSAARVLRGGSFPIEIQSGRVKSSQVLSNVSFIRRDGYSTREDPAKRVGNNSYSL